MSELAERQAQFQAHLLTRAPAVEAHIVGDAKADAARRLDVYYHAYRLRLVDVLKNDFAGLQAMLGEDAFRAMALEYLDAHPSQHPSVRYLGRRLPAFLQAATSRGAGPELAEMARFEWAWGLAFDAPDAEPAGEDVLAGLAPEAWASLRARLHPSLQRISLQFNVPLLFGAVSEGRALPELVAADVPADWAVWRRDLRVYWRSLERDEAWALDAVAAGRDFGSLCEGLCDWHPAAQVPLRAAALLRNWLQAGLLSSLEP